MVFNDTIMAGRKNHLQNNLCCDIPQYCHVKKRNFRDL